MRISTIACLLVVAMGCGEPDPCVGTRDLVSSPAALELRPEEHSVGWGSDACFQCHQVWNIHAHDCLSIDAVDVDAIDEVIDVEDTRTCVICHGDNGVEGFAPPDE